MDTDKIRVLWIDDRPEDASSYPEDHLPENLSAWFEITHHQKDGSAHSYSTAEGLWQVVSDFMLHKKYSDVLPAEIVLMDYDLSKAAGTSIHGKIPDEIKRVDVNLLGHNSKKATTNSNIRNVNFDGLLVGSLYTALFAQHPTALLPMTSQEKIDQMSSERKLMRELTQSLFNIDFSHEARKIEERKWDILLPEGIAKLRKRIGELYFNGQIVVSPADIMNLVDSASHDLLTIHSPLATRRLPVQGLFIDVPEGNRKEEISKWARELQDIFPFVSSDYKAAEKLSDNLWEYYSDVRMNALIEKRHELSLLHQKSVTGEEIDSGKYQELCNDFKVDAKKSECNLQCTMKTVTPKQSIRRLVVLLQICKFLKLTLRNKTGLKIEPDDIYLSLYPLPGPIVFPWDEGVNITTEHGWYKNFIFRETKNSDKTSNPLNIEDVLEGMSWVQTGPYGLKPHERIFLRGLILDDVDLCVTEEELRANILTEHVLYGKR